MNNSVPSALDRRLDFERKHPEIRIIPPHIGDPQNSGVNWLALTPDHGTLRYNSANAMMDDLEAKYP